MNQTTPCKKLGLAAIMLKILRFILIRHCLGWPLPPRPGECFDGSSGGSYPINRGSSVLSTSNEDSRLVWTSSFIHSLARAQLGVGAGGVVGVASLLGTGPEWGKGGRGKTLHHSVPFFKWYLWYFKKFKAEMGIWRPLSKQNKQPKNSVPIDLCISFPPTGCPALIPGICRALHRTEEHKSIKSIAAGFEPRLQRRQNLWFCDLLACITPQHCLAY